MSSVRPLITSQIAALAPGFRALSICVEAAPLTHPGFAEKALADACQVVMSNEPAWAQAHLGAWADVFRGFGAKPQRTPCSAEALRKRVLRDHQLPCIDPVVDLYNAISLEYAIPVGGENLAAYVGTPRLVIADGDELFDAVKDGQIVNDPPEPGEVIWRDDVGVTCRRWNWRQGVRTRLSSDATRMWFILESLPQMPLDALQEAGGRLVEGLGVMMPGALVEQCFVACAASNDRPIHQGATIGPTNPTP